MLQGISLKDDKCSFSRGGQVKGGRMVMLQKWSLNWRENGHFRDVVSCLEGGWSFYRGVYFNGHMIFYCIL